MTYQVTDTRYIEIDGIPLETPAWHTVNLLEVWKPAQKRGGVGVLIPHRDGRLAVKARPDESVRTITLWVENHVDWNGDPYTDLADGFVTNLDHLKSGIVRTPDGDDPTRHLTLHLDPGGDWEADVVVLGMDWNEETGVVTIDVSIPDGELTLTGS